MGRTTVQRVIRLLRPFVTLEGQKWTIIFCTVAGAVISVSTAITNHPTAGVGDAFVFRKAFFVGVAVGGAVGAIWVVLAALVFACLDLYNDTDSEE